MPTRGHESLSTVPQLQHALQMSGSSAKYNTLLIDNFAKFSTLNPYNSYCPALYTDDNLLLKVGEVSRVCNTSAKRIYIEYIRTYKNCLPSILYDFLVAMPYSSRVGLDNYDKLLKIGEDKYKYEEYIIAYYVAEQAYMHNNISVLNEMLTVMLKHKPPIQIMPALTLVTALYLVKSNEISPQHGKQYVVTKHPDHLGWIDNVFQFIEVFK